MSPIRSTVRWLRKPRRRREFFRRRFLNTITLSPRFCSSTVAATEAAPAGRRRIRLDFQYDGGGLGKGGTATLFVDGRKVGEGRIDRTQPMIFSADETADVGEDDATPVSEDYPERDNEFTGRIHKILVELDRVAGAAPSLAIPRSRSSPRST